MKVYYVDDLTRHYFSEEEEPVQLSKSNYDYMGEDEGASSVEEIFERWQAHDGETAPEFDRRRVCTECDDSPVFESIDEAVSAHDGNLIDGYTGGTMYGDGGHRVLGWPRSFSVGDVVDTGDELYLCAPIGFKKAEWA